MTRTLVFAVEPSKLGFGAIAMGTKCAVQKLYGNYIQIYELVFYTTSWASQSGPSSTYLNVVTVGLL